MRQFKSGMKFCAWRWTQVSWRGVPYLTRLHVLRASSALMLPWIHGPDPHEHPHDHPIGFLSIVLRGWYEEDLYSGPALVERRRIRWLRIMRARDVHRIVRVAPGGALTLVLGGPATRDWGFHVNRIWVPWRRYRVHFE